MKKKVRKITLHRETLCNLDATEKPEMGNTVQLCTEGTFACSYCHTC